MIQYLLFNLATTVQLPNNNILRTRRISFLVQHLAQRL